MKQVASRLADMSAVIFELVCIAAIVIGVSLIFAPAGWIVGGVLGIVAMQAAARSTAPSNGEYELARRLSKLAKNR